MYANPSSPFNALHWRNDFVTLFVTAVVDAVNLMERTLPATPWFAAEVFVITAKSGALPPVVNHGPVQFVLAYLCISTDAVVTTPVPPGSANTFTFPSVNVCCAANPEVLPSAVSKNVAPRESSGWTYHVELILPLASATTSHGW